MFVGGCSRTSQHNTHLYARTTLFLQICDALPEGFPFGCMACVGISCELAITWKLASGNAVVEKRVWISITVARNP